MFNPFVLKKYAALFLAAILSVISYTMGNIYFGLWGGIGLMFGGLLVGILVGSALLKHPFTLMLEGKGILVFNLDSTGIIRPFVVSVNSPFINGKLENKEINDIFDREATFNLAAPLKAGTATPTKDNGITIELNELEMNKGRFALFHFPLFLYNAQLKSIITKDFLSTKEKDSFAEHGVLYLNRKMEELTSTLRDFARYVVEQLKPSQSIFKSKWIIWIIIGFLVVLAILFGPAILNMFKEVAGTVSGAAGGGGIITPRG
jgi:hypothetical protein